MVSLVFVSSAASFFPELVGAPFRPVIVSVQPFQMAC